MADSSAGSTTTTSYVGRLETYSITTSSGPTNITTTDYIPAGKVLAESVNGTLSYLATSYQGSIVEALDNTGAVGVTASQLYSPYGSVRYVNGSMPTDYGYTGQRSDASTGLDYYGARYYDPTLGQFTSADTLVAGGLNRYGYVGGNPTTATDPSGHQVIFTGDVGARTGEEGFAWGVVATGVLALGLVGYGVARSIAQSSNSYSDAVTAARNADIAANTYAVAGASVYVTALGALVVTTGATVTSYAVGSAGWLSWNQQVSAAWTGDTAGAWNTGRVRTWVATHDDVGTTGPGDITETGTGTGGGGGAGAGAAHPPAGGGSIADGGGAEPPGDDDPCTCNPPSGGSGSPANPLENVRYSDKVQSAMGNRWASGDYFHAFPDIVDNYGADGETFPVTGGDGVVRTGLRIPGGYLSSGTPGEPGTGTWYDGVFEYIIEPDGSVNHRLFRPC